MATFEVNPASNGWVIRHPGPSSQGMVSVARNVNEARAIFNEFLKSEPAPEPSPDPLREAALKVVAGRKKLKKRPHDAMELGLRELEALLNGVAS